MCLVLAESCVGYISTSTMIMSIQKEIAPMILLLVFVVFESRLQLRAALALYHTGFAADERGSFLGVQRISGRFSTSW